MEENTKKYLAKPVVENYTTIENLRYGNLDRVQDAFLEQENIFTSYVDVFSKTPYPFIYDTYNEIEYLYNLQEKVLDKPNFRKYYQFVRDCDKDIHKVFRKEFRKIGVKYDGDYLEKTQEKLGALIMKLKDFYNRPRPFQVAYYTGQNLHPFPTFSGHSPAYPSGHSCQAHFLMRLVAFQNPSKAEELLELGQRIADTRLAMGVHYPSDNEFGKEIAIKLAREPRIRKIFFERK